MNLLYKVQVEGEVYNVDSAILNCILRMEVAVFFYTLDILDLRSHQSFEQVKIPLS